MKNEKANSYTPGPWTVEAKKLGFWVVSNPCNAPGAFVAMVGDDDQTEGEGREIARSNAALIAAAPDLLAALEALTTALAKGDPQYSMNAEEGAAFEAARAAIAKAKGE